MSESDKMGLFGSKDENNEPTSAENKNADEPDKEQGRGTKQESASDRYAPYDIDSDSETYDTEALSIMDINDIIGVQGDTAGDSTLESEFAALSEIITDSKDEYVGLEENSNVSDTRQRETVKDSALEGGSTIEREDKAQSSSGTASINKSLQLIGEAYISEDSRETEVEDVIEPSEKKSEESSERVGSSAPSEQLEQDSEVGANNGGEEVTESRTESSGEENTAGGEKSEDHRDATAAEEREKSRETLEGTEIVESADSTDAAIITEPKKPKGSESEMMDVDSTVLSDPMEKLTSTTQSVAESSENEEKINMLKEEVTVPVTEEAKLATEAADEPMDVDEATEILANLPITGSSEKDLRSDGESSNPDAAPTVQPEVGKRSHDEDSVDIVESSEDPEHVESFEDPEHVEEDSSMKSATALEEKCELEQPESLNNKKIESERSDDTAHREPTVEKKSNAEEDAPLEEAIVKEIPDKPIEEPRAEAVQEKSPMRDDGTECTLENREFEAKEDSGISKVVERIEDAKEALDKPEAAIEPMEVDEPEQQEIEKPVDLLLSTEKNSPPKVESVSNRIPENKLDDAQETLESSTKCPEIPGSAETKIQIPDSNSAEKSTNKSTPDVKTPEESREVAAIVPAQSVTDATESLAPVNEEEKMEVDGSSQEKLAKEEMETSQPCTSPQNISEPITKKEISSETIDDKPSIDTVDDAPIASPEVERTEAILEKSVPSESEDSREIVTAVCSDEMAEKNDVSKDKTDETRKEEIVVENTKNAESSNENPEKETEIAEEQKNTAENQNNIIKEQDNTMEDQKKLSEEQENLTAEQENVTEEKENITGETEKIIGETEKITGETENITEETENIAGEAKNIIGETENITGETENITGETDKIIEETENITGVTDKIIEETENITRETENITGEAENITEETENITGETETITGETENIVGETQNITGEKKDITDESEDITGKTANITQGKEVIAEESEAITDEQADAILNKDKEEPQISVSAPQPSTNDNCPLEKANSPSDAAQPSPVENEKDEMEENRTNEIEHTSNCVTKIELPQEKPKIDIDSEPPAQEKEIFIPSEKAESLEKEIQDCESENQDGDANLDQEKTETRFSDDSVSKDEKEDLSSPVNTKSSEEEKREICRESAELPNEVQEANVISSKETEICSEETEIRSEEAEIRPEETEIHPEESEIRPEDSEEDQKETKDDESVSPISPEKAESLDDELELAVSPEAAETSNEQEEVNSIPVEKIQYANTLEKDASSALCEAPSNTKMEKHSPDMTNSPNNSSSEARKFPDMEIANQEEKGTVVCSEKTVTSSEDSSEVIPPEKDSTSQEEKMDDSTSSPEQAEPSIEEEKLSTPECMENEEEQIPDAPENQTLPKDKENLTCAKISKSLSTKTEQDAISETIESPNEENEDSPITVKKAEHLKEKEENVSPSKNENEREVVKSSEQVAEKKCDESAGSKDSEEESSLFVQGTVDETAITEQEEQDPLNRKVSSDESTASTKPASFETKAQRDEDVKSPVVLALSESLENPIDDDPRPKDLPERNDEDQEMEIENKTETNILSDSEDKNDEANLAQLAECLEQSSTYKTEESRDEIPEKCVEDSVENLKDILSSSTVCVTQVFQDDEQSQSTQEMMESILETDKGNINNILDNQEVDDLEECSTMNGMEKLSKESDNMLNKALEDPMTTTNIDSLEGLLDLDLIHETDETNLKSVGPIVDKVMQEGCDDIETIDKDVDVALLMEENDTIENTDQSNDYDTRIAAKIMDDSQEMTSSMDELKSSIQDDRELEESSDLIEKDLEAFDFASVVTNPLDNVDPSEETKINLAEDLLREIAVDEERKIKLTEKLLLENSMQERDLLLSTTVEEPAKIEISDEVFLPVEGERDMELSEDILLDSAVRDQVLNEVAAEIENLPQNSEISELESAVKFLQESEEQDIDTPLVLSPKMVEDVVDDIVENSGVGIFTGEADICEDHSELVAELESIIPDPIAISEAEIINEAAKLEIERKTKLTEASKLSSPIAAKIEPLEDEIASAKPSLAASTGFTPITKEATNPDVSLETRAVVAKSPEIEKIEREPLKKSTPIPKISILEERLKIPPKIEIPVGEPTRMCDLPTTPKTSLLIQRDVRVINLTKQLESPKSMEKRDELRIVDTPRKDSSDKHDFENVGSPRIILKIAKSAIADCSEPRSPKSPKIRSATNSPNPEDSPGQKLGKIKLKLSKGGHPSIISNDNFEEQCGQWHTEGSSSLSPLGMKIKFSKISDSSGLQVDKHEIEETREPATSKHKFEEAKRTDSPLGMKIKLSRTGEPSIVQQETKESAIKHKDKFDVQQDVPKRTESSIGMKIKLSKSGDASIIQPDKQETGDEHKDASTKIKEKLEATQPQQQQYSERTDTPRRTESPLGMKFKLFKTGDASIVQAEKAEDSQQDAKRTDSPLGKKTKPMKTRSATSVASLELNEDAKDKLEIPETPRRTESPLGMKIKLSKRGGDASIIHNDETLESSKPRPEVVQETSKEGPAALKIKAGKSSATVQSEVVQETESIVETPKRSDAMIGMKIKFSKSGDASIVHPDRDENTEKSESHQENVRKIDPSIGVKIKFLRSGDASIIQSQSSKKSDDQSSSLESSRETENTRTNESPTAAKTKYPKCAETGIVETSEKREKSSKRKDTEMPIEMKIKLSKTGHPTIVTCENYSETQRGKESSLEITAPVGTSKQSSSPRDNSGMKILKSMHAAANLHGNRSELTIEPIQLQTRKSTERVDDSVSKRKDITISPIESKKAKHETKLSHILPEVTIQPIVPRDTAKQQIVFEKKAGSISRQQMNVISQEISITQVRSNKPMDLTMTDKLKSILTHNPQVASSDCEIIEHRPELIIVNENSNSSQDVMIIEEVPAIRGPENKVPKKRGRPRRNPLPIILAKPTPTNSQATSIIEPIIQRDPLALDDVAHMVPHMAPQIFPPVQTETHGRPKRTCRNQKSYAPPRRGRGRGGRGKRKMDVNAELSKRPRIDQDLDLIEQSTTALITIHEPPPDLTHIVDESPPGPSCNTSELYKALRQPTMDRKMPNAIARDEIEQAVNDTRNDLEQITRDHLESSMDARLMSHLDGVINTSMSKATCDEGIEKERKLLLVDITTADKQIPIDLMPEVVEKAELLIELDEKIMEKIVDEAKINKDATSSMDQENWLAPSSKKQCDGRNETNISNVQVMDEETRMSAESGSRSQTPAKNMSVQAPETIVNEESQGSVLSTATTESEKVKVKNRRMEIHFDPDEGPFSVDKVAEYDWPLDPTKKTETFMIQEQISHYLGVKSFKRKYPDLKRRMVDMEERNYLRENGLVSEAMCDMGLTAVVSSEVLDVMCSDFPDQYEEYRKHIREKHMKEHFKKQKELTAAANAEKNRIDLAEMAVQSALSWNIGLNKARRESRKCSLDLQTFTIHVPKKQQKIEEESGTNHYPVALIPGQYTDYYREYTPAELRYYPLNTVLYGPMKPNERKFDSQSEGSQSDSDSDSSSDDSSSSSSEGTQDTEASQSTMDDVDAELSRQKEDIKDIKCKMCLKHLNKFSRSEVLIQCGTCNGYVHPSCIDLTLDMVPHIQAYAWQCTDCKTCAQCHDPADEDKMLFCDMCDRGYHIYCVGLRRVPQGRWHCQECAVCASCGSRDAGGTNSDRNSVAQWQHEYKKGDKNTRVYVSTLCVPCSKLWRKGRYCPHCSRCHTVPRLDLEVNLVHCCACDKYLHLGCVETKDLIVDRKNYRCDFCQPLRHHMVKPLVSKVFKT